VCCCSLIDSTLPVSNAIFTSLDIPLTSPSYCVLSAVRVISVPLGCTTQCAHTASALPATRNVTLDGGTEHWLRRASHVNIPPPAPSVRRHLKWHNLIIATLILYTPQKATSNIRVFFVIFNINLFTFISFQSKPHYVFSLRPFIQGKISGLWNHRAVCETSISALG
jgi:hypothetical protein